MTDILAIYGSVLATIVFFWEVFKYYRDKPRLKVRVNHHLIGSKAEHKIGIEVVNTGTKPIFISAFGFEFEPHLSDGNSLATVTELPQVLEPGQNYTCLANREEIPVEQIAYSWARDATGKIWKSKKWPLKT